MGIEFKSKQIKHGVTHEFSFSERINKYIIGFKMFDIYFKDYNYHCFKNLGLNIEVTGIIENKISVRPIFVLNDNSGNQRDDNCFVEICVIAWTGTKHDAVQVASNQKLPYPLEYVDSAVKSGCILSGFELAYTSPGDITVSCTHVATSMDFAQSQFIGSGTGKFCNSSMSSDCRWVKGSIFLDSDESSNLYVKSFSDMGNGDHTIDIPENLNDYCCVLTSINLETNRNQVEQGIKCGLYVNRIERNKLKLSCVLQYPSYDAALPSPVSPNSKISGLLIGALK